MFSIDTHLLIVLPVLIALAVITSMTDIREGKIRTKHCLFAVLYGLSAVIVSSLIALSMGSLNPGYVFDYFLNLIISIVISFLIWLTGIISAGDLKLFIAYSSLVPLSSYSLGYVKLFPSSVLLVNTFVPLLLFSIIYIMAVTSWKEKVDAFKRALEPRKMGMLALAIFGFSWFITWLMGIASFIPRDYFTLIVLMFLIITISERVLKVGFTKLSIAFCVLRIVFDTKALLILETYYFFAILFISMLILRFFLLDISSRLFVKKVGVSEIKEGMIIASDGSVSTKGTYYDFLSYLQDKALMKGNKRKMSHMLTKEEAEDLRLRLGHEGVIFVEEHMTIPFAPFMAGGVFLTILFGGDAVVSIRHYLPYLFAWIGSIFGIVI